MYAHAIFTLTSIKMYANAILTIIFLLAPAGTLHVQLNYV
jgi:hypothetical protein